MGFPSAGSNTIFPGYPLVETSVFTSDPALPDAAATHSHALWRTLLEATGDGVLVLGARGAVLAMNPAFGRLFALPPQAGALEGLPFGAVCERLGEAFADTTYFLARAAELQAQDGPVAGECWTMSDGRILESDVLPGARGGPPERAALAVARRHRARPAPGR